MNLKKGFTLIELIIVIAIIGILATIVIVTLSGNTDTATTNSRQIEAAQLRNVAEVYKLENGSKYTGLCTALASNATAAEKTEFAQKRNFRFGTAQGVIDSLSNEIKDGTTAVSAVQGLFIEHNVYCNAIVTGYVLAYGIIDKIGCIDSTGASITGKTIVGGTDAATGITIDPNGALVGPTGQNNTITSCTPTTPE